MLLPVQLFVKTVVAVPTLDLQAFHNYPDVILRLLPNLGSLSCNESPFQSYRPGMEYQVVVFFFVMIN